MNASGTFLAAGGLAFVGSFKEADGWPSNGYAVIAGTTALTFLASLTDGTPMGKAVKWLGVLMLLGAAYRYIPALTNKTYAKTTKIKKGAKSHG
jgi:hypothetical protein